MIDSHCHLDFDAYDKNRETVINDAVSAGVHTLVNIGCDLASSERSIALAEKYDAVYATVGVHPHDAKTLGDDVLQRLRELAVHKKVVAIGEIGLDFYRDLSPRNLQRQAFEQQLELAADLELPVVIHTRESFERTCEIVGDFAPDLKGGVFHCFPGNDRDAHRVIDMGFLISVGGVITYKNSQMARTATAIPLEHIILETDSPYLTPVPFRGRQNSPANIPYVRDKLAELKGISPAEVEKVTDQTCRKLYGLIETFEG